MSRWMGLYACCVLVGCGMSDSTGIVGEAESVSAKGTSLSSSVKDDHVEEVEDLDMQASDFECLLHWDRVRNFRITNRLGHRDEALAVANNASGGGAYPVGTVIQIIPDEAMVKRRQGWNPGTNDWEFFKLQVNASGTTIDPNGGRGADISNLVGSCKGCHSGAQPQFDFTCESGHGCGPLPFGLTSEFLVTLQERDPRCR